MSDDINWKSTKSKDNVPDEDYKVSYSDYERNLWFVKETWKNLQAAKVPDIEIQIEEHCVKPKGSIVWLIAKTGSCIPVAMNITHDKFKAAFRKAGGIIFSEIKFLDQNKPPRHDKKISEETKNLGDLYAHLKQKVTNVPYEKKLFDEYEDKDEW